MKAYIRSSGRGFDTSADYLRRELRKCIDIGRRANQGGSEADRFEAYRLLGSCSQCVFSVMCLISDFDDELV